MCRLLPFQRCTTSGLQSVNACSRDWLRDDGCVGADEAGPAEEAGPGARACAGEETACWLLPAQVAFNFSAANKELGGQTPGYPT